ncbi:hypothetical protein, partial [Yoonia sp.]|uniref:hypothetical protein n=1 Tax=Yoonia sp. TaxID=2212373 RepID=UPI00238E3AAE
LLGPHPVTARRQLTKGQLLHTVIAGADEMTCSSLLALGPNWTFTDATAGLRNLKTGSHDS